MHVILDWVANHSAWDNPLVTQHPDWYDRDWKGDFRPTPWWDWSDIIDFDFRQTGMRRYMAEAMLFWVREADVDGFRADVAGYVPLDFWERVRADLDAIKPVFMLAECEMRDLHYRAFDATYAWELERRRAPTSPRARPTSAPCSAITARTRAPGRPARCAWPMSSNHDQNAWEGTEFEQFGAGAAPTPSCCRSSARASR